MEKIGKEYMVTDAQERNDLRFIKDTLEDINRKMRAIEVRQTEHEAKTSELIQLYKGAGIIGKIISWCVVVGGGIGALLLTWKKYD